MEKANRLSRRSDQKVDIEKDNKNQIFIKDCQLYNLYKVVIDGSEVNIIEKARDKDEEVVRVVNEIKKTEVKML